MSSNRYHNLDTSLNDIHGDIIVSLIRSEDCDRSSSRKEIYDPLVSLHILDDDIRQPRRPWSILSNVGSRRFTSVHTTTLRDCTKLVLPTFMYTSTFKRPRH